MSAILDGGSCTFGPRDWKTVALAIYPKFEGTKVV